MTQVKNFSKKKKNASTTFTSLYKFMQKRGESWGMRVSLVPIPKSSRGKKKKQFPENLLRACTFRSLEQQPPTRLRVNGILRTNARAALFN